MKEIYYGFTYIIRTDKKNADKISSHMKFQQVHL
jgi:hypothetical protein